MKNIQSTFRVLIVLYGVLFASTSALASGGTITHCEKFAEPLKGGFCVHKPEQSTSRDVLYYLHGLGNSEKTWSEEYFFTKQIRDYWSLHNLSVPTVVTISLGEIWLLAEKNASPASGLLSVVAESIIPSIEKSIGGVKGRRLIVGESMGGFNSIQLALKTSLFEKAGIICAPMATISPFSEGAKVDEFIKSSVGWQYYKENDPDEVKVAVAQMIKLSRAFFPTPDDWKKSNPLVLAETADPKKAPKLYVTDGFHDKYLSYEATELFVKTLAARGFDLQWRPQWGGHCVVDVPSLAQFLVN